MRAGLILLVAILLWPGAAGAQEAALPAQDVAAIQTVITQQLDAFNRGDAPGAYAFASDGIKAIFPSAAIFMQMVREGSPAVYRSREAEFLDVRFLQGQLWTQEARTAP